MSRQSLQDKHAGLVRTGSVDPDPSGWHMAVSQALQQLHMRSCLWLPLHLPLVPQPQLHKADKDTNQ